MSNIGGNKHTQGSDYFCIVEPNPLENKLPLHLTCSIHKQISGTAPQQMLALFRHATRLLFVSIDVLHFFIVIEERYDKLLYDGLLKYKAGSLSF